MAWWKATRLDWTDPDAREAERLILTAYPAKDDLFRVAQNAGVDIAAIDASGSQKIVVRRLLDAAARSSKLAALLDEILASDEVAAVHEPLHAIYQPELISEPPPPEPDNDSAKTDPSTGAQQPQGIKPARALIIALLVLLVGGGLLWRLWPAAIPQDGIVFARHLVWQRGDLKPVGLLDEAEQKQRRFPYYQLEYEQGRVVAVRRANGWGGYVELTNIERKQAGRCFGADESLGFSDGGIVEARPIYDAVGKIIRIEGNNRAGGLVQSLVYEAGGGKVWIRDRNGNPASRGEHDVVGYERVWNQKSGYLEELRFLNANGVGRPMWEAIFAIRYQRDSAGRLTSQSFIAADGKPIMLPQGSARRVFERDPNNGELISVATYDTAGEPTLGIDLVHRWQLDRDEAGNCLRAQAYNGQEALTPDADGVSQYRYIFTANERNATYLNAASKPTPSRDGYSSKVETFTDGYPTKLAFLDATGSPTPNLEGASALDIRYDKLGQVIERRYLGRDGKPVPTKEGFAIAQYEYDQSGQREWVRYFGIDEKPIMALFDVEARTWKGDKEVIGGYAALRERHDVRGNRISWEIFDKQEKAALVDGYSAVRFERDEKGFLHEMKFVGGDGEAAVSLSMGCALVRYVRDRFGRKTSTSCHDMAGNGCLEQTSQCARSDVEYDDAGNEVRLSCKDEKGELRLGATRCAIEDRTFDARGYRLSWACKGLNEELVTSESGAARADYQRDRAGRVKRREVRGIHGQPSFDDHGLAVTVTSHDDKGRVRKTSYLGVDGKACFCEHGHTGQAFEYDARGHQATITHLGEGGQPAAGVWGFAESKARFNDQGYAVEVWSLNEAGTPAVDEKSKVHRTVWELDARGLDVVTRFYGVDGRPALSKERDDVAVIMKRWSPRGQLMEQRYFAGGSSGLGAPATNRFGIHRVAWAQSAETGQYLSESYFDQDSKPQPDDLGAVRKAFAYHPSGVRSSVTAYDAEQRKVRVFEWNTLGQHVLTRYYADGAPGRAKDGLAETRHSYDVQGRLASISHHDAAGALLVIDGEAARKEYDYDARGHRTEFRYFDRKGELFGGDNGVAIQRRSYNARGNVIRYESYSAQRKLVNQRDQKFAVSESRYDERDRLVERWYLDKDGEPIHSAQGFGRRKMKYDGRGRLIEKAYFDKNDEAIRDRNGVHKEVRKYDARGALIELSYRDQDDVPQPNVQGVVRTLIRRDAAGREQARESYREDGSLLSSTRTAFTDNIRDLDRGAKGLAYLPVIASIAEGGPLAKTKLRVGDVVLSINGKELRCDVAATPVRCPLPAVTTERTDVSLKVQRWEGGAFNKYTIKVPGKLPDDAIAPAVAVALWN